MSDPRSLAHDAAQGRPQAQRLHQPGEQVAGALGNQTASSQGEVEPNEHGRAGGLLSHFRGPHGLMMLVCCVPMLVVAGLLIAAGASPIALVGLLGCLAMMAVMMWSMAGDRHH